MTHPIDCTKFGDLMTCEVAEKLVEEYKNLHAAEYESGCSFDALYEYAARHKPNIKVVKCDSLPYHTFEDMKHKLELGRPYEVFDDGAFKHPFWSMSQMEDYMAWHDVDGHIAADADFTPDGECEVFAHHASEMARRMAYDAVDAMIVEILYRIAWICTEGWTFEYKPVLPGPVAKRLANELVVAKRLLDQYKEANDG